MGKLADGSLFAPKYIENKLKFFPHIKEAVAFGAGREDVCAFINIDLEAVGNWAERRGMPYAGYTDLASKDEVYQLIADCVEQVNADLASDPKLCASQVSRFLILHKELDPDDDELTRTRKVRRAFIAQKYGVLIDALFDGKPSQFIETEVKFEDGRVGRISADLKIRPVRSSPSPPEPPEGQTHERHRPRPAHRRRDAGHAEHFPVLRRRESADGHLLQCARARDPRHHRPQQRRQSSMLNVINGVYTPQQGGISFRGERFSRMNPRRAAEMGIARTFQNLALFKGMSVLDNIMTGRNLRMRCGLLSQAFRLGRAEREEIQHREFVENIIDFLEIQAFRKTPVGRLPYGLQKRVDLGRALAMEPRLLLLDEPMAGMNIEEKQDMSRFILDVNDEFGTTIVLIEHDMGVVMDISDRVVVLDYGKKIGDGKPDEVRANEDVIRAYLGVSH